MLTQFLLLILCLTCECPQDTIVAPNGELLVKKRYAKIESGLLLRLEQFETDIQAGVSHSIAFRRFEGFLTNKDEQVYLEIITNGNDFDVTQYVSRLGGKARIAGQKRVYCYASPEIIRKISELADVIRVELFHGAVHRSN